MAVKVTVGNAVVSLQYAIGIGGRMAIASYFDRSEQMVKAAGALLNMEKMFIGGRGRIFPVQNNTYISIIQNGKERFSHGISIAKEMGSSMLLYTKDMEEDVFYSYFMKNYDLPLLKEWTSPIKEYLSDKGYVYSRYEVIGDENACMMIGEKKVRVGDVIGCSINLNIRVLEDAVSVLLKSGRIRFTDQKQKKIEVKNMDDYFSKFSHSLVSNLKEQMVPVSEHTQEMPYMTLRNMRLYPQQISQDVGVIRALLEKKSRYAILNMGMGTGKTIQAASICEGLAYAKGMKKTGRTLEQLYADKDAVHYRVIVMCPSHLVEKWVKEINREIPYARAVAITDFGQLLKIREHGKERMGKEFYVISKDFAKLSYQMKPCVTKYGSRVPKNYVCTNCGGRKPLEQSAGDNECHSCGNGTYVLQKQGRVSMKGMICPECGELLFPANRIMDLDYNSFPLEPKDFAVQNAANTRCHLCGANLWSPCVSNLDMGGPYSSWVGKSSPWKKVTHYANKAHKAKKTVWVHKAFEDDYYAETGERPLSEKEDVCGVRKYAPASFIKKYLKGYFDVAIFDEMHLYKGGSTAQGNAMHALIKASKYQLGLTGTIAGGYANHLFYTLFRLDPARMIKKGFSFTGEMQFCEKYGSIERKYVYLQTSDGEYNSSSRGKQQSSPRVIPGISPLIFTDFLLDKAVFLDLSDMSRFLPPLKERVISVPLEKEVAESYNRVVSVLSRKSREKGGFGLAGKMLQFSLSYADKPYSAETIKSPKDGSVVCIPDSYDEYASTDKLLSKEKKLVELVGSELAEGRKCVVYAEFTASPETCISYRLKAVLQNELHLADNEVVVLESSSPEAIKREAWLHKMAAKGAKVFITNPRCVETGLDLCFTYEGQDYNYPTLIFYQMGYNLFTIWQASRRAYRLNQKKECRTYYLAYEKTIQTSVIKLIAEKQVATAAIQGHFSSEGLAAMAQGVDARLKLIQALASADTSCTENELQNMFDVLASSDSGETYENYKPMRTLEELLGKDFEETQDEGNEDLSMYDMLFSNDLFMSAIIEDMSKAEEPNILADIPQISIACRKREASRREKEAEKMNVVSLYNLIN